MSRLRFFLMMIGLGLALAQSALPARAAAQSEYVPNPLEIRVYGQSEWLADSAASARVVVMDHTQAAPIHGAAVRFLLEGGEAGTAPVDLGLYHTDTDGTVHATLAVRDVPPGSRTLTVRASATGLGVNSVSRPLEIVRKDQVLITTDKPLYQPGQTIHIRALALRRPNRTPAAAEDITLEVADSKGNKVFKKPQKTSDFGIASADFILADEVNMGEYQIRAVIGDTTQTKTVTVDRYVLPKFRIAPELDKPFYLPGETVHGSLSADYFFGEPVEGGEVSVVISTFDVEFRQIARLTGKTDAEGAFEFEAQLPDQFVGQPLEEGKAFLQFEISVIDGADHEEKTTVTRSVAADPIDVAVIPESGDLVPGVENMVFVVTTYPDGSPAKTQVSLAAEGTDATKQYPTSEAGVARVPIMPTATQYVVTARDDQGQETQRTIELTALFGQPPLLLRPDKALYSVGQTLAATVFVPAVDFGPGPGLGPMGPGMMGPGMGAGMPGGFAGGGGMGGPFPGQPQIPPFPQSKSPILFDIVRDGQTVLTDVARPTNGRAQISVDLTPAHVGTLQLHAYQIAPTGEIVRDTRVVYVSDTGDLNVKVEKSAESYLPGNDAQLVLSVSDQSGKPVPAALGVEVVDESVFALSENQPGLERVYFTLQRELLTPRYEIHGFEPGAVVRAFTDPAESRPAKQRQEDAAAALFAAASDTSPFSLTADSWDDSLQAALAKWQEHVTADATAIMQALKTYADAQGGNVEKWPDVAELVRSRLLTKDQSLDPLGQTYGLTVHAAESIELAASGMDGKMGTDDDLMYMFWGEMADDKLQARPGGVAERRFRMAGGMMGGGMGGAGMAGMRGPAGPKGDMADLGAVALEEAMPMAAPTTTTAAPAPAPVRIREWFPETLYVNPQVITDERGRAELSIPMADSITTWRLTAMANSRQGSLGSTTAPIKVFQDFFVDIDLPVQLTAGDQVSIPVAVYNYLPGPQTVGIALEKGDWFELAGDYEQSLSIASREVSVVYFPITVKAFGNHTLTVHGNGSKMSDAVKRPIRVVPNGKRLEQSISDRLEGTVKQTVTFPAGAVPGASTILVKIYPGMLSQVVEGLDAILQMPFGCFEQTSSTTYPNILVLDYLRTTKQTSPEVEMKATEYISTGYQRLLSFEVAGGGFEWFGSAPANKILTAYGVLEFSDMSKVFDVEPAVIQRTQQWLISQQDGDGSWSPDASYLHAESWSRIQNNKLLPTAYIGWALGESGNQGSAVDAAMAYVRGHIGDSSDPYTLGICANALVAADPQGTATDELLRKLTDSRQTKDGKSWWQSDVSTICHGEGDAADIEATALIGYALIRAGKYPDVAGEVVDWLISKKDASGTWYSTQATVLALKTLLASMGSSTSKVDGEATVVINGQKAADFALTPENSDVLQQVDLRDYVRDGANEVEIRFGGEGSTLYQIASLYYMPWGQQGTGEGPLSIGVSYDREELTTDDTITAQVTIKNNRPGKAKMVVVDLGIPPGFTLVPGDLEECVGSVFAKFTQAGQQVIIYFDEIDGGAAPVQFSYRLKAKYPLRAKTPRSRVYEYYNPAAEGFAQPEELVVSQR